MSEIKTSSKGVDYAAPRTLKAKKSVLSGNANENSS